MTARIIDRRAFRVGGLLAVGALLITGCAGAEDDSSPEQRSFPLKGKSLTLDVDDSGLEVVPADVKEVRVTRWFVGKVVLGGDAKVTWKMDDDRLSLRLHCSGVVANCAARHRVEVPRDVAVTVKAHDGSVRATTFRTPLTIRSHDGSVHVKDVSGALDLESHDGSVRAEHVRADRVRAFSSDGSVHLSFDSVPDRVVGGSSDGSVRLTLPGGETAYRVRTQVDDGSTDVSVPKDDRSAHLLDIRSRDGSVRIEKRG